VPKGKQREVLALAGRGHTVVLGTAGSGKTTMAIHRAAILADPMTSHAGKVLLCTFNRTLLAYLRYWRPPTLREVVFENYHRFARGYLASRGKVGWNSVCDDDRRLGYVTAAVVNVRKRADRSAHGVLDRPARFFADEIRFIDQHGLDATDYIQAERFGRGMPFARELRPHVLDVREEYARLRAADGFKYDWNDIAHATLAELRKDDARRLYRHVVIDEGQDFSPAMLRSLAAAVPPDGSLTFFGDMAQQIYGRQVSWKQAGLRVPHGVWYFKRNYRNTPEIAALGLAIAAMPYFRDVPDMVKPDEFEPSGPKPSLVRFATRAGETRFVVERAREAARTGSVAVLMRRREDEARFRQPFLGAQYLHRDMLIWNPGPGISFGTVHAAKGYEFDQVFIVGVAESAWPEPVAIAADGEEAATASDGQLLYVAVTRAKRELIMTYVGSPTRLLPENKGLWLEQTA
jgi:superfamily I DNA/RNA helicase